MAQQKNARIIAATFNEYSTATQAERELENNGVPSNAIQIQSNRKTAGAGSGGSYKEEHRESGFMGWWNSLFGSDHDEDERAGYERAIEGGSTVMLVTADAGSVDSIVDILNRNGAVDIDRRSGSTAVNAADASSEAGTIPVVEEELTVGKRAIRRGGVRVYSHTVTEPVEEQITLREERVDVQRRPVNRDLRPDEAAEMRDRTIEVTEMAEEPVVSKRARVREEVVVEKNARERAETVRDNVRHTEVEVEPLNREDQPINASGENIHAAGRPQSKVFPAGGMDVKQPTPGVQSGFGTTAGAGTLAGETTAGSAIQSPRPQDFTADYRRDFEHNYPPGSNFESLRPAYEYGYRSATNEAWRGRSWDQVENNLRADYEKNNPGSAWDRVKNSVRYGWEKATGKL